MLLSQPENLPTSPTGKANRFWQDFAEADYKDKIILFQQMLEKESLLNETTLFEMLEQLYVQGIEADERGRFDDVVATLRQAHPDTYEMMAPMLLDWQLVNALADGRMEEVASLTRELAATAAAQPITFHDNLDRLAYHDQLALLVDMMQLAWPELQTVATAVPGSREGFAARATDAIIYHYLDQTSDPDAHDPELLAQLEQFFAVSPEHLDQHMAFLTGQIQARWQMNHFEMAGSQPSESSVRNLQTLALGFVGYLYREENVAYSKADLTRHPLPRYILDRHSGVLYPREPLGNLMSRSSGPPIHLMAPPTPDHILCPDRQTFKRYLERLLVAGNPQPYRAAALIELIPAWLRYLEACGLIDGRQREQTSQALAGLEDEMGNIWQPYRADPAFLKRVS